MPASYEDSRQEGRADKTRRDRPGNSPAIQADAQGYALGALFGRIEHLFASLLLYLCLRHFLVGVKDAVVTLQVAQKSYPVVHVIPDYEVAPAIAALYEMLVQRYAQQRFSARR